MKNNTISVICACALACVLSLGLSACSAAADEPPRPVDTALRLRFEGTLEGYGPQTRAAAEWTPGERIYLLFHVGGQRVTARAIYHNPDPTDPQDTGWSIDGFSGALTPSLLAATCQAFYIADAATQTAQRVELSAQSVPYGQTNAACFYDEGVLIVRATLRPLVARLRFLGTAGRQVAADGLARLTAFDATTATFTATPQRITATVGANGSTSYFYVLPADSASRQLTLILPGMGTATRTLEATALTPAATGYITLPTAAQPGKWTIMEPVSGEEFSADEDWDEGAGTSGTVSGEDFPADEDWDEGAGTNGSVSGEDFPADEDWNNSIQTYDPYAHDENWD